MPTRRESGEAVRSRPRRRKLKTAPAPRPTPVSPSLVQTFQQSLPLPQRKGQVAAARAQNRAGVGTRQTRGRVRRSRAMNQRNQQIKAGMTPQQRAAHDTRNLRQRLELSQVNRERMHAPQVPELEREARAKVQSKGYRDVLVDIERHNEDLRWENKTVRPGTKDAPKPKDTSDAAAKKLIQKAAVSGVDMSETLKAVGKLHEDNQSTGLTVLKNLTRPSSAVSSAVTAVAKGENVPKALGKGFVAGGWKAPKIHSFSDTLRETGLDKKLGKTGTAIVGLGLDIATDPTTYLSLGTASPAMTAARSAGRRASGEGASAIYQAKQAAFAAEAVKRSSKGLTIGLRGTPVSVATGLAGKARGQGYRASSRRVVNTSGRSTSYLASTARRGAAASGVQRKRVIPDRVRQGAASALYYKYRPPNRGPVLHEQMREAGAEFRARRNQMDRLVPARADKIKKFARKHGIDQERVFLKVDAGRLDDLKGKERELGEMLRRDLRELGEREVDLGIRRSLIGDRKVEIPAVTADVKASAKDRGKARRAAAAAERELRGAREELANVTGRAEILSRNVTGTRRGEVAAARGERYAGGGLGVRQANERLAKAERRAEAAMGSLKAAHGSHAEVVALAKEQRAARREAEKLAQETTGYMARYQRSTLDEDMEVAAGPGGPSKTMSGQSLKQRKVRGALEDESDAVRGSYITDDLPLVMARRHQEHLRNVSLSEWHGQIAATSPRLKSLDDLPDGALGVAYVKSGKGFKPLWSKHDMPSVFDESVTQLSKDMKLKDRLEEAIKQGKDVRAIPDEVFQGFQQQITRGQSVAGMRGQAVGGVEDAGLAFDKVQGTLKTLQTVVNPGYHLTNLIGDAFLARQGGASLVDLRNGLRALIAERRLVGFESDLAKGVLSGLDPQAVKKGNVILVRTKEYGNLTAAQVLEMERQLGVVQGGNIGQELFAQTKTGMPDRGYLQKYSKGKVNLRPMNRLRIMSEFREDVMRSASFVGALNRGMNPKEAAQHVRDWHFDYGDLTSFERRGLRRIIPFYTFASRNAMAQGRALGRAPGVLATFEKTRNEAARQSGLDLDWDEKMQDYVQRALPVPIPRALQPIKVEGFPIAVANKLPATDLNLLNPLNYPDEFGQRMTLLLKVPIEQWQQYNFFFRDKVRQNYVPAPSWATSRMVKGQVDRLAKYLGVKTPIKMIRDPRTGQMIPGWNWRVDSAMRLLPITGAVASATTPGRNRYAGSQLMGVANYISGQRQFVVDPGAAESAQLFDKLERLTGSDGRGGEIGDLMDEKPRKPAGNETWGGLYPDIKKKQAEAARIRARVNQIDLSSGRAEPRFAGARGSSTGRKRKRTYGGSYGSGGYGGTYGR